MTPFSRTTRSIHSDSFGPSLMMLVLAVLLLLAWNAWFFFAQVSLTEISQNANVVKVNLVEAEFPPELLARMGRGQAAFIYLEDQATPIEANVSDVWEEEVQLLLKDDEVLTIGLLNGHVEVEVESVSPATLVLRAAGLLPTPQQNS